MLAVFDAQSFHSILDAQFRNAEPGSGSNAAVGVLLWASADERPRQGAAAASQGPAALFSVAST